MRERLASEWLAETGANAVRTLAAARTREEAQGKLLAADIKAGGKTIAKRDDASAAQEKLYRWGAMGHDGAQAVNAAAALASTIRRAAGASQASIRGSS